ncbi:hypothetical protein SAY87_031418 [Trapa incisa]|uniref:F-box domain-containing protein n=1 Tax=Trapa incisa TaxID=236973 RepID=A0AAN7KX35_9MYRT|nr:hypothetical protein SAY87_031418 [Trapa incisa]
MNCHKIRSLPEDVILQILVLLPVKSLIRAKAVCKMWHKFISEQYFVRFYNGLSVTNPTVLVKIEVSDWDSRWIYVDSLRQASQLSLDFLNEHVKIRASHNGFLCCSSELYKDKYYICNPMTREYTMLPREKNATWYFSHKEAILVGLDYDLSGSKFNVVVVASCGGIRRNRHDWVCSVFDSESGKWRQYFSKESVKFYRIVLINGTLYWPKNKSGILLLDLNNNLWRNISLPNEMDQGSEINIHCLECDGFLSVIQMSKKWMKIWLLKNYNREDGWDLVDEVNLTNIRCTVPELFPISQNSNCIFFAGRKEILVYEVKGRVWKQMYSTMDEPTTPLWCTAHPYVATISS